MLLAGFSLSFAAGLCLPDAVDHVSVQQASSSGLEMPPPCVPSPEVCDNLDNDCDGIVDQPFNLLEDSLNCGICGHACQQGQFCERGFCNWNEPVEYCRAETESCNYYDDDCANLID
jgi:hypothetical protein